MPNVTQVDAGPGPANPPPENEQVLLYPKDGTPVSGHPFRGYRQILGKGYVNCAAVIGKDKRSMYVHDGWVASWAQLPDGYDDPAAVAEDKPEHDLVAMCDAVKDEPIGADQPAVDDAAVVEESEYKADLKPGLYVMSLNRPVRYEVWEWYGNHWKDADHMVSRLFRGAGWCDGFFCRIDKVQGMAAHVAELERALADSGAPAAKARMHDDAQAMLDTLGIAKRSETGAEFTVQHRIGLLNDDAEREKGAAYRDAAVAEADRAKLATRITELITSCNLAHERLSTAAASIDYWMHAALGRETYGDDRDAELHRLATELEKAKEAEKKLTAELADARASASLFKTAQRIDDLKTTAADALIALKREWPQHALRSAWRCPMSKLLPNLSLVLHAAGKKPWKVERRSNRREHTEELRWGYRKSETFTKTIVGRYRHEWEADNASMRSAQRHGGFAVDARGGRWPLRPFKAAPNLAPVGEAKE
jgi:hypothetical protein